MPDIVLQFVVSSSFSIALIMGVSIVVISIVSAYYGFQKGFHKLTQQTKLSFLADSLDFDTVHADGKTLMGKSGSLTRVFILHGKDYGICNAETLKALHARRVQFFDQIVAKESLTITIFMDRVHQSSCESYHFDNPQLQTINDLWQEQFQDSYQNRHYIVVSVCPSHLQKEIKKGNFDDTCDRFREFLDDYDLQDLFVSPEISSVKPKGTHTENTTEQKSKETHYNPSPLLSFWESKINGDSGCKSKPATDHLSDRLVRRSLHFDLKEGVISFDDEIYAGIVSVNTWGEESDSGLMKELMTMSLEFSMIQHIQGISKLTSQLYLDRKRANSGGLLKGLTPKKFEEFELASQIVENDDGSLHKVQLSFVIYGSSAQEVQDHIKSVKTVFRSYGVTAIQEKLALEVIWRSQFPGSKHYIRQNTLLSQNLSDVVSFPKEAEGTLNSDWGPGPLRHFKTINGGSFPLNIHGSEQAKAVGHNLVIAPTNAGKTTFIQHLIAGALRHENLRVFLFDRLNGTRIFTESCGGEYVDIEGSESPPLNPFVDLNTQDDHQRLRNLLRLMSGLPDKDISDEELDTVIDLLSGIPADLRILENIHEALLEGNTPFSEGLRSWATGSYKHWFNGKKDGKAFDALSLESKRLVGFEMTNVMGDSRAVGPLVFYLIERILSLIRSESCPSWIVIDETKPLLAIPEFREYVAVMLREFRKLGGCVTLCFQSMRDVHESGMKSVILEQCQTLFIFQNPKSDYADYEELGLTESEWDYVKGKNKFANRFSHTVLVKKPTESVILDINLSSLGRYLKLYSSDKDDVLRAKKLQKTAKNQGREDQWVDLYL